MYTCEFDLFSFKEKFTLTTGIIKPFIMRLQVDLLAIRRILKIYLENIKNRG